MVSCNVVVPRIPAAWLAISLSTSTDVLPMPERYRIQATSSTHHAHCLLPLQNAARDYCAVERQAPGDLLRG